MKKETIKFSAPYDKLQQEEYHTVRGKGAISEYTIGSILEVIVMGKVDHFAKITAMEQKHLTDLTDDFLFTDTSIRGKGTTDKYQFVKVLNSFRGEYAQITVESNPLFTILYLKKVKSRQVQSTLF